MIRTVTGSVDPGTASPDMELLGAHELLVTSPDSHAGTIYGAQPGDEATTVTLETLAAIRTSPETHLWNVMLPSAEEIQRELEEGAAPSPYLTSTGPVPSPMLVLHAPGATPADRTPLRRLAEKVDPRILVVTGALPALPSTSTPEILEKAGQMLAHRMRFGLPLVAPKPAAASSAEAGAADEEEESVAALHDQAQRVGLGFIGLLELLRGNEALQEPLLTAAAHASVETGAPILLTTQDAFGRVYPNVDRLNQAIETLLVLKVPASGIVLCRLPCDPALEPIYVAWLQRGVTLGLTFQGAVFYNQVFDNEAGTTRDYPSDGAGAALVASLCRQGFGGQLLLSPGVACRLQLGRYGGHGYGHVRQNVVPMLLQHGVGDADLSRMQGGNVVKLLRWWTPPPPVEREVEMGTCSWCGKAFEMRENEYFHKFSFVYCRSKCLSKHGDTGWKPLEPK